ncbi:hypothetical protein DL89DRAFT_173872 [Linderina pennispora]|uniref:Biogenesis of lysosome-related organelles complex 1 subunit 7 n=1 Tax=Linderina pennispora TaxID=61395 RepID=A0A1Y1W799_9FUNG|nr:uncharacterized protein DL89DRAFT_173872 [Linderina pennispora]ORX69245.1 hypothetical protein DL89DRAFT_173872 [Linderina pennispora]
MADKPTADASHATRLPTTGPASTTPSEAPGSLTPSASSILRVLLPSLTRLDEQLESVWSKQDVLNEVLDRIAGELELFDELVVPPGANGDDLHQAVTSKEPATMGLRAAARLKDSRARIAAINVVLKRVRTRLDNVAMLAQAKALQNQQQAQSTTRSQGH